MRWPPVIMVQGPPPGPGDSWGRAELNRVAPNRVRALTGSQRLTFLSMSIPGRLGRDRATLPYQPDNVLQTKQLLNWRSLKPQRCISRSYRAAVVQAGPPAGQPGPCIPTWEDSAGRMERLQSNASTWWSQRGMWPCPSSRRLGSVIARAGKGGDLAPAALLPSCPLRDGQ